MAFVITLPRETLEEVIKCPLVLRQNANADFTPEKLILSAVSEERKDLVRVEAGKATFTEYNSDAHEIVWPLGKLAGILELAEPREEITLSYEMGSANMDVEVGNLLRRMCFGTRGRDFDLKPLQYDFTIKSSARELWRAVKAAEAAGYVEMSVRLRDKELVFETFSNSDRDATVLTLPEEELEIIHEGKLKDVRGAYSIKYLSKFVDKLNVPKVELQFAKKLPLIIRAPLYGFNNVDPTGNVTFVTVPITDV